MPQPLPRSIDRELDLLQVAAFARGDVNSPIRLQHFINVIFNLNFGHILTAGERPDFLHRNTFKVLFSDEFFGHRPLSSPGHGELFLRRNWPPQRIAPVRNAWIGSLHKQS